MNTVLYGYNFFLIQSFSNLDNLYISLYITGAPQLSNGSVLDHRSLTPVFESRRGRI